jgi:hypothetical protein
VKRLERERLIERYLSGAMSSSEEQDFFIEVAADRELRTELKAYQIVESAVRKDRLADTASYTALRSHMIGLMGGAVPSVDGTGGTSSAAPSAAVPVAGTTATGAAAGAAAGSIALVGSAWLKWLLVAGAASVLATGAAMLGTAIAPRESATHAPAAIGSGAGAPIVPRTDVPTYVKREAPSSPTAAPVHEEESATTSVSDHGGRARSDAKGTRAADARNGSRSAPQTASDRNRESSAEPLPVESPARSAQARDTSRSRSNESSKIKLLFDPPRQKQSK